MLNSVNIANPVKVGTVANVTLSVTADANKLHLLESFFNSLNLSGVTDIHLNLPYLQQNKHQYNQTIIDNFKIVYKVPRIHINRLPYDSGPIKKILPCLQKVKTGVIISLDTSKHNDQDIIQRIIKSYNKSNGPVICSIGYVDTTDATDYIDSSSAVLYDTRYITDELINDIYHFNNLCRDQDSVTISHVLNLHKVKIKCLEYKTPVPASFLKCIKCIHNSTYPRVKFNSAVLKRRRSKNNPLHVTFAKKVAFH